MNLLLIFFSLNFSSNFASNAFAAAEPDATQQQASAIISVFKLFQSSDAKNEILAKNPDFSVKSCPKVPPQQWAQLLLMQQPVPYKTQFAPGCDIEGNVTIGLKPFPVHVKFRNLKDVHEIKMTLHIKITPKMEQQGIEISFQSSNGKLLNKKTTSFSGEFKSMLQLNGKPLKPATGFLKIGSQKIDFIL